MAFGTVYVRLRPIKLAFLVHPQDKGGFLEAIKINTFLWGGIYNPIIPTFQKTLKVFQDKPFRTPTSKEIFEGYLNAYDPDYVVPIGKCSDAPFDIGNREKLETSCILDAVEEHGIPRYGIGLFELLNRFIDKELKYVRRRPLKIIFPEIGNQNKLFLASVFGALPDAIDEILENNYEKVLGAEKVKTTIKNYFEYLPLDNLFLRRFSSLYVRPIRERHPCIFFLDATKSVDIIDYWNLRAMGWNIIPVPKQAPTSPELIKLIQGFVEANFRIDPKRPEFFDNTTLLKSRTTAVEEVERFREILNIPKKEKGGQSKITPQNWYPRIWDDWARGYDGVDYCELEAASEQHDISESQQGIDFKTVEPKFISRYSMGGGRRFANEIELRLYGGQELLAEVFPEGDERLASSVGSFSPEEARFSKRGLVYLSSHSNWTVHIRLPKAEDVFEAWLESKGWKIEISPPGRIAKQMLKQLGGVWGLNILASEGIIKLLGDLREGKPPMNEDDFRSRVFEIAGREQLIGNPKRILEALLRNKMFRLGLYIQCPVCSRHTWYSVKDMDYEIQCPCGEKIEIPSHSPKEMKWSYRTYGPFSFPNRADGAYTVLLALRFFSRLLDGATTPIMSFTAECGDRKIEADLALLFKSSKFGDAKTEQIFIECKTFNRFETKDIQRMAYLGKQFPGSIITFATFNKSLTEKEKKLIRPLVNRSRIARINLRPHNPVLILTGTELFSSFSVADSWKKKGGDFEPYSKDYMLFNDLPRFADATNELYLAMQPFYEWLDEQRRTKSK